jgi:hypothetical protein
MPKLYNKESDQFVGTITEAQLQFLRDQLEEESAADTDYWFNRNTLDMLEQAGAEAELMGLLRKAIADRDEVEVRWAED